MKTTLLITPKMTTMVLIQHHRVMDLSILAEFSPQSPLRTKKAKTLTLAQSRQRRVSSSFSSQRPTHVGFRIYLDVRVNDILLITILLAGCTTQACGFRDIWEEFTSLDYDVYGVSADAPTAQSKWQTKVHCHVCQYSGRLLMTPSRSNFRTHSFLIQRGL